MTTELEFETKKGMTRSVLGLFEYADDTVHAIHELKNAGFEDMVAFTPIPVHDIEHALEHGRPKRPNTFDAAMKALKNRDIHVLRFTLIGMFGGIALAWLLGIGTAIDWAIPQGGMPIVALPPVGLITYEAGSLGAALGTIFGFMWLAKLPTMKDEVYDISLGSDKFGIAVKNVDSGTSELVRNILTECRAVSVEEKVGILR